MTRKKKSPTASIVRSSAAEYLDFVAASGQGGVDAVYADGNVWLSQRLMAQLYDVETQTINCHLKKVFSDSELEEEAVVRNLRISAADGKSYDTKHYNLSATIAVGYKVKAKAEHERERHRALLDAQPRAIDAPFEQLVRQRRKPTPRRDRTTAPGLGKP